MICKNCGTGLDVGTRFCAKCGAQQAGTPQSTPTPQQGYGRSDRGYYRHK